MPTPTPATPTGLHTAVLKYATSADLARELAESHAPNGDGPNPICATGCHGAIAWPCSTYRAAVRLIPDVPAEISDAVGAPAPPAHRLLPLVRWAITGAAGICEHPGPGPAGENTRACAECAAAAVVMLFRGPLLQVRFVE